jgi:hypothetical protein
MKKILLLVTMFLSAMSYGQTGNAFLDNYHRIVRSNIFEDNTGFSVSALMGMTPVNGAVKIEGRLYRGGMGFDWYEKAETQDGGEFGFGFYYITPSIHGFDLSVGAGLLSHYTSHMGMVGQQVSGYYRSNGTYVNPYQRYVHEESIRDYDNSSIYSILGLTKQITIYKALKLELKTAMQVTNHGLVPLNGIGIKLGSFN